jgi:hypothetical protein
LPGAADNRELVGWVLDQGGEGSCGGHMQCKFSTVLETSLGETMPPKDFSPRYAYDLAKIADDPEGLNEEEYFQQSGTTLAALAWVARRLGALPEGYWPYAPGEVDPKTLWENEELKEHAKPFRVSAYYDLTRGQNAVAEIDILRNIKAAVAETGACGLGILVSYGWLDTPASGIIPESDSQAGGHAVLCCGYDDKTQMLTLLNSWGAGWGAKGFGFYRYEYLAKHLLGAYREER